MAVSFVRNHTAVSIKTAGTNNLGVNISTATGSGNTLIARILFDNAAVASTPVVSGIAKAAGEANDWVLLGAARSSSNSTGSQSSGEMWAIRTSVSWPVAAYTVTLSTSVVQKATVVAEFSGVLATVRSTTGTAYSASTTQASATTTGTTPSIGDLALGFIFGSNVAAAQAGDNDTTGGAWSAVIGVGSTGSSGATNNFGVAQYKVLTAASHQTLNNSATMTVGNGAIVAILQANPTPPPTSSFTASSSTVVVGGTVTFTDTSTGTPTGWAWNFGTGASPATATTQGPHVVTYSTLGTSNVTLTTANASGSGTTAGPTAVSVTLAPISTLVDGFDTQINSAIWTNIATDSAVWEAGRAKFPTPVAANNCHLVTGYNYTLVDSSIYLKLTPHPTPVNNANLQFRVFNSFQSGAYVEVLQGGSGYEFATHIENLTASDIDSAVTPYNPTANAWWKISCAGTTITIATSPDALTWTTVSSGAWDDSVGSVRVEIFSDPGDGLAGAYSTADSINVTQPAITQAAYRLYADGTETGSTALAAQDTGGWADVTSGDVSGQVRVRMQSTTAVAVDPWDDFQLQWEKNTSGTWTDVAPGPGVVDRYDQSNVTNYRSATTAGASYVYGQSFIGNGTMLSQSKFWLRGDGAPTGTLISALFTHTGVYGVSSKNTGTALATSTPVAESSLSGTSTMVPFTFDGTYQLQRGVPYVIGVQRTVTDSVNTVWIGFDNTSPTASGNLCSINLAVSTEDHIFEVSGVGGGSGVISFDSPNLTDGAATTNRLTGGTGTFTAGKVSEDGLVDDLGWAGNNFTELLYSVTFKQADLDAGDTIRFRVLRNGATTGLTFTQYPTVGITKTVATPKASTLTDTFDTQIDTAKWDVAGTTAWAAGRVALTDNRNLTYSTLRSKIKYDLVDSAVYVKMTPAAFVLYRESMLTVWIDANNSMSLFVGGATGILAMRHRQGASNNDEYVDPYDPVAHAWLRIRLSGTTGFYETSPDGTTWTVRRTGTTPLNLSSVTVELACGQWQDVGSTSTAYFDNLNIVPAPVVLSRNIRIGNAALQRSFNR